MSKNYFRSQLRKLGKGKEKRNKSTASIPLETSSPSPSPVHVSISISKRDSSYSLSSSISGASSGTTVQHPEECLERKEVISITGYVQKFVAAISELKKAIEAEGGDISLEKLEDGRHTEVDIRVHLRELIHVVYSCLDQYQSMRSTEIKNAATELMSSLSTCDHEDASHCLSCNSAVDILVDAFTTSVQIFLGGEEHEPLLQHHRRFSTQGNLLKGVSKSHDNLTLRYSSCMDLAQPVNEPITDEIDEALAHTEDNIGVAARYIKMRNKYQREVTTYLSKRGHIEMRYQQEMLKLAKKTHYAVSELKKQECLPLVDLFLDSVDQDMRFASNCNTTYNVQVYDRVIEPLEHQSADYERVTKELMHTWQKELKKLTEATTTMKSAKTKYQFTGQESARIRTLLSVEPYGKQADKRKREVMELEVKWKEAEAAYKSAVAVCNACQYQVHKSSQQSILCAYRRLVLEFDRTLKSKLETYFQLQHNFFFPIPDVMDSYLSTVHDFEIGAEFMLYIKRQPTITKEPEDFVFEVFKPEEVIDGKLSEMPRLRSSSSSETVQQVPRLSSNHLQRATSPQPYHSWGDIDESGMKTPTHTRSLEKTQPNSTTFLLERNESKSKHFASRNSEQPWLLSDDVSVHPSDEELLQSKNAITHSFITLRTPSRCRECDNFVYFNGYECETCGLACHRKCLAPLSIRCGSKRLDRKLTTFGVEFLKHLEMSKTNIPIIVTKCMKEIEDRGLDTHGLYRISASKSKLEHLCQLFESGVDRVDLSDRQPHLIASCLKLYFQQLPEPIFTFSLYEDMISFATETSPVLPCNLSTAHEERKEVAIIQLQNLRDILSSLDHQRYLTLARLFYHLKRVSSVPHVKKNSMPASNLGIVFGPTLLRRRDTVAPLVLLTDMTAQAKAIEILISHVNEVFTVSEDEVLHVEDFHTDEDQVTEERLVDGLAVAVEHPVKYESDIDDSIIKTPYRTPFGTPPQRRRENVCQLAEVLEALQYSCQPFLEHGTTVLEGEWSLPDREEDAITSQGHNNLPTVASKGGVSLRAQKSLENNNIYVGMDSSQSILFTSSPSIVGRLDTEEVDESEDTFFPPTNILHSSASGECLTEGHLKLYVEESYGRTETDKEANTSQETNECYPDSDMWREAEVQSSSTYLSHQPTTEMNKEKGFSNARALVGSGNVCSTPSSFDGVHISPSFKQSKWSSTGLSTATTEGSRQVSLTETVGCPAGTCTMPPDCSAISNNEDFSSIELPPHSCTPVGIDEETDEVVTTFHYDSDDSDLSTTLCTTSNPQQNVHANIQPVSPWHDKNRKIRINPLRVLKMKHASADVEVSPDLNYTDNVRMMSPTDVTVQKVSDNLERSRSCGLIHGRKDVSSTSQELLSVTSDHDPSY